MTRDLVIARAALEAAFDSQQRGLDIRGIDPAAIVAGVPPRHKAERVMDELNHHALDENQRLAARVAELSKGGLDLASALVDCKAERDALRTRVAELEADVLRLQAALDWQRDARDTLLRECERLEKEKLHLVHAPEKAVSLVLENANGVQILEEKKFSWHYGAANATCHCGMELIVAPMLFHADHHKGDPVMVCGDMGVHAYRFNALVPGRQPTPGHSTVEVEE